MILRPYQQDVVDGIYREWDNGARVVCAVLPTGAGKTVIFSDIIRNNQGVTFAIAHRQELVGQMSMALARCGVVHGIQAPKKVIQWILKCQTGEFQRHFYDPQAKVIVGGVLTLLNRQGALSNALNAATLWVIDENHHLLRENSWGKAVNMFRPSCRGLGVTATPERADGRGIGRYADGLADVMVQGPGMRQLIRAGYLTDYRIFGPYTSMDLSSVAVSNKTGDYSKPQLVAAVRKSQIIGDVVRSYTEIAPGKIGVTFVPDVRTGEDLAASYVSGGVPARVVHAKTPDKERQESTAMLARGDLKQLVNVDIFGEGYDLPAIEVISMARPTESYPLYCQQFGRGLRIMDGKTEALIIDHVKNVKRHGLPDSHREWSLDSREKRSSGKRDPDAIPIRTCRSCMAVYESWEKKCPFCGAVHMIEAAATIEQVEGVITELDPAVLAAMRGEVDRIDADPTVVSDRLRRAGAPAAAVYGAAARHRDRQTAQAGLRDAMSVWAGYQAAAGQRNGVVMRRFFRAFGTDVLSAQVLGRSDAEKLTNRILQGVK